MGGRTLRIQELREAASVRPAAASAQTAGEAALVLFVLRGELMRAALSVLLLTSACLGAVRTSSGSGNWSNSATWGGNPAPGNGDTAVISAANVVTVDVNTTVGTSGVNGTNAVAQNALSSQVVVATGVTFVLRGDFQTSSGYAGGTPKLVLNAGSTLEFDSSLAASPATTKYAMKPDGNFFWGFFQANGTANSRCTVRSNAGGGNGYFSQGGFVDGGSIVATYTDFLRIGDASNPGFTPYYLPNQGFPTTSWDVQHSSFTSCGAIAGATAAAAEDAVLRHAGNLHQGTLSSYVALFQIQVALTTGVRNIAGNVFDGVFGSDGGTVMSVRDMTIDDNFFYAPPQFAGVNLWASYARNLFRTQLGSATGSLLAQGNVTDSYFVHDLYTEPHLHTIDVGPAPTAISFLRNVFESTYFLSDPLVGDDGILEALGTDTLVTETVRNNIVLPTGDGIYGSASLVEFWGPHHTQYDVQHNTMACPRVGGCVQMEYENVDIPNGIASRGTLANNIFWGLTNLATNFAAYLDIENPITDFFVGSNVKNNDRFNVANTDPAAPHAPANQGNSYIGAWTVTPNNADKTVNPQFVDSMRNLATFDTAYLRNAAAVTWASQSAGHVFALGDVVSDQSASYYRNALINYRCILSHTKSTANSEPGIGSDWHTYWEFNSLNSIRVATYAQTTITDPDILAYGSTYIQALILWIQKGFSPLNLALRGAGSDGLDIGAVSVSFGTKTVSGKALSSGRSR